MEAAHPDAPIGGCACRQPAAGGHLRCNRRRLDLRRRCRTYRDGRVL